MKKKHKIREEARQCYGNLLNYTKFNLISNHHDAEDLVSQAYIRFFNSYDKGKSNYKEGTNILGYLKLIVKNLYIDKVRKKKGPQMLFLFIKIQMMEKWLVLMSINLKNLKKTKKV